MNELASLTDHLAAVNVAKFSPDDKKLITGGDDMRVLAYDVEKLSINSSAVSYTHLTLPTIYSV